MAEPRYDGEELRRFVRAALTKLGVRTPEAETFALSLVDADLKGIMSHGVARLDGYVQLIEGGLLAAGAEPETVVETPALALIDARNGLGQVAGTAAMERAIGMAREVGIGWVVVRGSNHYGTSGYYAAMALEAGMIGLSATNSGPVAAATHGRERVLGTNPLAVAAPAGAEPHYLLDMATSAVAGGKLQIAIRAGKAVPEGWGLDRDGRHCTDPDEIIAAGALLPLGSFPELSSHKGFGLAMMVELLTGVIGGGVFGRDVGNLVFAPAARPTGVAHVFAAIDIARFMPLPTFRDRMDAWLASIRTSARTDGADRIYTPGEKEWIAEARHRRDGIELEPPVRVAVDALGRRLGIGLPVPRPA